MCVFHYSACGCVCCVSFCTNGTQVYDLMREARIRPNSRSLLELVNLCRANGLESVAARIMRQRSKMAATTSRRNANVSRRYATSSNKTGGNSTATGSSGGGGGGGGGHGKGSVSTRKNAGQQKK